LRHHLVAGRVHDVDLVEDVGARGVLEVGQDLGRHEVLPRQALDREDRVLRLARELLDPRPLGHVGGGDMARQAAGQLVLGGRAEGVAEREGELGLVGHGEQERRHGLGDALVEALLDLNAHPLPDGVDDLVLVVLDGVVVVRTAGVRRDRAGGHVDAVDPIVPAGRPDRHRQGRHERQRFLDREIEGMGVAGEAQLGAVQRQRDVARGVADGVADLGLVRAARGHGDRAGVHVDRQRVGRRAGRQSGRGDGVVALLSDEGGVGVDPPGDAVVVGQRTGEDVAQAGGGVTGRGGHHLARWDDHGQSTGGDKAR
jgi:hypothetical protein